MDEMDEMDAAGKRQALGLGWCLSIRSIGSIRSMMSIKTANAKAMTSYTQVKKHKLEYQ